MKNNSKFKIKHSKLDTNFFKILEKIKLTEKFVQRKKQEYDELQAELEMMKNSKDGMS